MFHKYGLTTFVLLALAVCLPAFAEQDGAAPQKSDTGGDCSACHRTSSPSMDDLLPAAKCRRLPVHENLDEAALEQPDVVIMDQLTDIYVPVVFPHKLHAGMEAIGTGCTACHHHGEEGKIVACRTCHEKTNDPGNLQRPGLKGAYHRQCLGCHREWSHDTACIFCHAKRGAGAKGESKTNADATDITGKLHPNVAAPDKTVYPTPEQEANSMVTFHHKDHVELFGKRCVDCHQKENCSRCHDTAGPKKHEREDPHEDCIKCHDTSDNCGKCHQDHEAPSFDHNTSTPFVLKEFHKQVACAKCHKEGKFAMDKKACKDCHEAAWFPAKESFDHAKAGLVFSEAHKDNECEACHPNGLGEVPDCTVCHDDKKYPQDLPGERVPGGNEAPAEEKPATGEQPAAEETPAAAEVPAAAEQPSATDESAEGTK